MNWDQISGQWRQAKGRLRSKWAKLTDDDLEAIAGRKDELIGRLQERYGQRREDAERDVDNFIRSL
ncbi:MAG TPA: PqqD family peptide modification chaperone [Polyangiaceae bacterium]|nr:PqqD family peptide modification chaperone [Polyangiaceae bacterium]